MNDDQAFSDPAEIRHRIGTSGTFSLQMVAGSVEIDGTDGDEVLVTARSEHGRSGYLPLNVRRDESSLRIEIAEQPAALLGRAIGRGSGAIDFEVTVPRAARVDINTVSADVESRGLSGDQAYRTVSGDVDVEASGGRVAITTVSGDVELASASVLEASVATTSGDVQVAAPELLPLRARTVSGDVQLVGDFSSGGAHTVETVSGDLSVETAGGLTIDVKRGLDIAGGGGRRLVSGDGRAELRFRSLSGDVELTGQRPRRARPAGQAPEPLDSPFTEPTTGASGQVADSLSILRALERGEIDVDEASRRLEGARSDG